MPKKKKDETTLHKVTDKLKEITHFKPTEAELALAKELQVLTKQTQELTKEVRKLKKLEFVKVLKRPWKFTLMSFVKGLMVGFGGVVGASLLVGLFIYILAQISVVPFIGDFVEDIIEEIRPTEQSTSQEDETDIFQQFDEQKDSSGENSESEE